MTNIVGPQRHTDLYLRLIHDGDVTLLQITTLLRRQRSHVVRTLHHADDVCHRPTTIG